MNRKNIIYTIILAVAIIFSYFAELPQSVIISIIMLIGGFFLLKRALTISLTEAPLWRQK